MKLCGTCGFQFRGIRASARYCSKRCQNAAWRKGNLERIREYSIRYHTRRRQAGIKVKKDWKKYRRKALSKPEQRIKIYARNALYRALMDGKLHKSPCACGNTRVHGHHEDYNRPLDVVWLCQKCHDNLHKARRFNGR